MNGISGWKRSLRPRPRAFCAVVLTTAQNGQPKNALHFPARRFIRRTKPHGRALAAAALLSICLCLPLAGCERAVPSASPLKASGVATFTLSGSDGSTAEIPEEPRVVSLYASYSEAWLLAGGSLVGVTDDVVSERGLDVGEAEIVGTVKEPNAEAIIALDPDLVILSLDITAQKDMVDVLEDAGLSCLSYRVDTFEDYSAMMYQFCKATGQPDAFEENVSKVAKQIEAVREAHTFTEDDPTRPTVLLIRAFSTGIKAKTDDELAGSILKELGCRNIADEHPSMLEDLSMEEVIAADPDYIFVTTMGDEAQALAYLDSVISGNPAWEGLSAIQNGRYHVLPKELFHYKPNQRWGESYQYLAGILDE